MFESSRFESQADLGGNDQETNRKDGDSDISFDESVESNDSDVPAIYRGIYHTSKTGRYYRQGSCIYTVPGVAIYKGNWNNAVLTGFGYIKNKRFFRGKIEKGLPHGYGQSLEIKLGSEGQGQNIKALCEGQWKSGQMIVGRCLYPDTSEYCGQMNEGLWHGLGRYKSAFGDIYEGEWIDGQRTGNGKAQLADGSIFIGQWWKGKRHGLGTYVYRKGVFYEGEWKEGIKHGFGRFTDPDQYTYSGQWSNDKRDGFGQCSYADGSIYIGEWREDKRSGIGVYKREGKKDIIAFWQQNQPALKVKR